MPRWRPGTRSVAFLSARNGDFDIWSRAADGTGEPELLLDPEGNIADFTWSPDGEWLLVDVAGADDILAFRPGVDDEPRVLLGEPYEETEPAVSPDGRWIAYASDETGRLEVYVRPFPDVDSGRWQISSEGGRNPQWAHGGNEIFFHQPVAGTPMWVAAFEAASGFVSGTPRVLFDPPPGWAGSVSTGSTYDVAPDDQRFLIATSGLTGGVAGEDGDAASPVTVLVNNFFEVLRQVVPE